MIQSNQRSPWITLRVAVMFLAIGALATSASAGDESGWQLRFYAAAIDMEYGSAGSTDAVVPTTGWRHASGGLGVNAEYRMSERLGIDLGLLSGASVDLRSRTAPPGGFRWQYDTLTFTPLTAGLDVHLSPSSRVDFYACPMVALISYGTLTTRVGPGDVRSEINFDEEVAFGAALGLGVPFAGGRWSFQARASYLDSNLEGSGGDGLRVDSSWDSTILGFGFGYRFGQQG